MKLLGDANWWIPGWLDRLMPTIDIEGTDGTHLSGTVFVDFDSRRR